jgi:hypothetical protein
VVFHSTAAEKAATIPPTARSDQDGQFSLTTFRAGDGAPVGDYVVTVRWQQVVGSGEAACPGPDLLPPRYNDTKNSDLRFHVAQGNNDSAVLQLRR